MDARHLEHSPKQTIDPATGLVTRQQRIHTGWQNYVERRDVNKITSVDALIVVNRMDDYTGSQLPANRSPEEYALDVNGDGYVTTAYHYLCSRQVGSPKKGEIFFSRTCRSARGAGVECARRGTTRAAGSDCSLGADQASLLELAA